VFILHPGSGVPIYRQLVEQVRRLIAGGQLLPGSELPSVREIALAHAVNPMTVSKAYSLLEAEGLLERRRGRAMAVAAGGKAQASLAQRQKQLAPQVRELVAAARQLDLAQADIVALVRQQWGQQA
jgi:GntR family transcriptional regulator